jgi:ferrous iron transport protein B
LRKAGTVILGVSVLLWVLARFPAERRYGQDYDGLAARAKREYLAKVASLDPVLGVPAGRSLLPRFAQAQLRFEELSRRFWKSDRAYRKARDERDAAVASLCVGSPALRNFLAARQAKPEDAAVSVSDKQHPQTSLGVAPGDGRIGGRGGVRAASGGVDVTRALEEFRAAKEAYVTKLVALDNQRAQERLRHSAVGRMGSALEVVLAPAGFDWKISSALVGALAAKEVFVSQLGIVYSLGAVDPGDYEDVSRAAQKGLGVALRSDVYPPGHPRAGQRVIPPLVAVCILLFCLVSAPCMATIAVTVRETNSWKWGVVQFAGLTIVGWWIAVAVYQIGSRLGLGI